MLISYIDLGLRHRNVAGLEHQARSLSAATRGIMLRNTQRAMRRVVFGGSCSKGRRQNETSAQAKREEFVSLRANE